MWVIFSYLFLFVQFGVENSFHYFTYNGFSFTCFSPRVSDCPVILEHQLQKLISREPNLI
jgi:hypothetical protein